MKSIDEVADEMPPTQTWWSHGIITWLGSFPIAFLLAFVFSLPGGLAYSIASTLFALYFVLIREPRDKAKKQREGTYRTPDPEKQYVSGMVDRQGDMISPVFVALGSWAATIFLFLI